ncbi:hypothetical protein MUK42_15741 [Musa troglodytarum]|uniref:Uncharacterized protein n=1 Tax=Musa troglodytarum TaxID=320322 RepID=A0A9E7H6R9_9LILI|nr:hypothetical protein MUK42_15741 [Musa troglodytarum]
MGEEMHVFSVAVLCVERPTMREVVVQTLSGFPQHVAEVQPPFSSSSPHYPPLEGEQSQPRRQGEQTLQAICRPLGLAISEMQQLQKRARKMYSSTRCLNRSTSILGFPASAATPASLPFPLGSGGRSGTAAAPCDEAAILCLLIVKKDHKHPRICDPFPPSIKLLARIVGELGFKEGGNQTI